MRVTLRASALEHASSCACSDRRAKRVRPREREQPNINLALNTADSNKVRNHKIKSQSQVANPQFKTPNPLFKTLTPSPSPTQAHALCNHLSQHVKHYTACIEIVCLCVARTQVNCNTFTQAMPPIPCNSTRSLTCLMMENTCALLLAYTVPFAPAITAQLTLQSPPAPPLQPKP